MTDATVGASLPGMGAPETVAVISSGTAIIVAGIAAFQQRSSEVRQRKLQADLAQLQSELDREARQEERALTTRGELDRYREPLLHASLELAHRLNNIREKYFLDAYLGTGEPHRSAVARTSTYYRLARYWCVVESLSDRVAMLRFDQDEGTRSVAGALRSIGQTFASDAYDDRRFMVWREEQRAIAELMRDDDRPLGCIGYATFVDRYPDGFDTWFASFDNDLTPENARTSRRLAEVERLLATLASYLDLERRYEDQWARLMRTEVRLPDHRPENVSRGARTSSL